MRAEALLIGEFANFDVFFIYLLIIKFTNFDDFFYLFKQKLKKT